MHMRGVAWASHGTLLLQDNLKRLGLNVAHLAKGERDPPVRTVGGHAIHNVLPPVWDIVVPADEPTSSGCGTVTC